MCLCTAPHLPHVYIGMVLHMLRLAYEQNWGIATKNTGVDDLRLIQTSILQIKAIVTSGRVNHELRATEEFS